MSLRLYISGFKAQGVTSVAELLQKMGQPHGLVERLWEPLCLATLNTPINKASAQSFLVVLRDAFSRRRSDSDLWLPKVPLGDLFPAPAQRYIEQQGGTVVTSNKVMELKLDPNGRYQVTTSHGLQQADQVVIATSAPIAARLLSTLAETEEVATQIAALRYQPITTVYLEYSEPPGLDFPMLGLTGTLSQWVFDHSFSGRPNLLAVVISAEGEHTGMDREQLIQQVDRELRHHLGSLPELNRGWVVKERRATFQCDQESERLRPQPGHIAPNLYLAGDYTQTGYPATLEGAVRSGVQCAQQILADS